MKMFVKFLYMGVFLFFVGCATSPYSDKQYNYTLQSYNATCSQIKQRMQQLDYRKANIRANDRFRFKYMLVIPGFREMLRINREEKNIEEERYYLRGLLIDKHCDKNSTVQQPPVNNYGTINQPHNRPTINNQSPYNYRSRQPDYMDYYQQYYGRGK